MAYANSLPEKTELVRERCSGLVGRTIVGYELAELWSEQDHEWSTWFDLPVFLSFDSGRCLSVWWWGFDKLGMEDGRHLPFSLSGSTVRWVSEGTPVLDQCVGHELQSVALANDEMDLGG